jgi:hypothetical protein
VDRELPAKLRKEADGILVWLVAGCVAWYKQGRLIAPEEVKEATRQYREEQDTIARFLSDECTFTPNGKTLTRDQNARYEFWCEQNQEKPDTKELKEALNKLGYRSKRGGHGETYCYEGITLKPMDTPTPDNRQRASSVGERTRESGEDSDQVPSPCFDEPVELDEEAQASSVGERGERKCPIYNARKIDRETLGKISSPPSPPSPFELIFSKKGEGTFTLADKKEEQNGHFVGNLPTTPRPIDLMDSPPVNRPHMSRMWETSFA